MIVSPDGSSATDAIKLDEEQNQGPI